MEAWWRLGVFLGMFAVLAVWEARRPRRPWAQRKRTRWGVNLGLTVLDTLCVRLTVGAIAVQTALLAQRQSWGLLPLLHIPPWANILLSLLVLDGAIYVQHVAVHAFPLLWRVHLVHHTDMDFDVTTGLRFHPLEIVLSMLYKAAFVLLLGAHPAAEIAFEMLLNATSQFNHSNVGLPARVERLLRYILITPDVHRIHHSVLAMEMRANFGFSVPVWDRLCGTYRDQPAQAHTTMLLGVDGYQAPYPLGLMQLLGLPFRPPLAYVRTTE